MIPREFVDKTWNDFTDFAKEAIDDEYYIHLSIDVSQLSCSGHYGKGYLGHYPMIYGYSDNLRQFSLSDFFNNGVYSFEKASYEEMTLAYNNNRYDEMQYGLNFDYMTDIRLWKKRKTFSAAFDLSALKNSLMDYIVGENKASPPRDNLDNYVYGIKCYDAIKENFMNDITDMRPLHLFFDRANSFNPRLDYLLSKNVLNDQQYIKLHDKCRILCDESLKVRNLFIKQSIKQEKQILNILPHLEILQQIDKEFSEVLLQELLKIEPEVVTH